MCIAHRLLLSTSEISDATASMPSPGDFALHHRVAPPRQAYSLTSSAFIAFGALYTFSLFKPVFRGSLLSLFFQLFNRKNPSQMKVKLKARYLLQFSEKSCIIETEAAAAAALINYRRKIKWQRMKYLSKHLQDTCM